MAHDHLSGWNALLATIGQSGDAALIDAVRCGKLSARAASLVLMLDATQARETGDIAKEIVPAAGLNSRQHTSTVRMRLVELERKGWARRLPTPAPVRWVAVRH